MLLLCSCSSEGSYKIHQNVLYTNGRRVINTWVTYVDDAIFAESTVMYDDYVYDVADNKIDSVLRARKVLADSVKFNLSK